LIIDAINSQPLDAYFAQFDLGNIVHPRQRCKRGPRVPKWIILGDTGHSRSSTMSLFDRLHMISY